MSSGFEDLREMLEEGHIWYARRNARLSGRAKYFWRVLYAIQFVSKRL